MTLVNFRLHIHVRPKMEPKYIQRIVLRILSLSKLQCRRNHYAYRLWTAGNEQDWHVSTSGSCWFSLRFLDFSNSQIPVRDFERCCTHYNPHVDVSYHSCPVNNHDIISVKTHTIWCGIGVLWNVKYLYRFEIDTNIQNLHVLNI